MKKTKSLKSLIDNLHLDEIDLDALKHLKFKRKSKSGKKKLALLALAAIGAVIAYKMVAKKK